MIEKTVKISMCPKTKFNPRNNKLLLNYKNINSASLKSFDKLQSTDN